MNVSVINGEVVFKPIKITVAWDPGRRKVVYDICADYKEEESGQAGRYVTSCRQSALKKLLFLDEREQMIGLHQEIRNNWKKKKMKLLACSPFSSKVEYIYWKSDLKKINKCKFSMVHYTEIN